MPESREEIAKLEALYANNPAGRVFTHLAEAYRKAGDFERARGILDDGIQKHPGYASAYVVLGRVLMDLDEADRATDAFRRVLELDPQNLVALRSLGDLARGTGRTSEALGYFEELRHLDPNNEEIEQIVADLLTPAASVELPEPEPADDTTASRSSTFEYSPPGEAHPGWRPEPVAQDHEQPEATETQPPDAESMATESQPEPWMPDYTAPAPDAGFVSEQADGYEQDAVAENFQLGWVSAEAESASETQFTEEIGDIDLGAAAENETWDNQGVTDELGDLSSIGQVAQEFEIEGETFAPEDLNLELSDTDAELAELDERVGEGEVVTDTIAELYRRQGLYDRAEDVYRALLRERPEDPELFAKLAEIEALNLGTAEPEAAASEGWQEPQATEPAELDVEETAPWLMSGAETAESTPTPYAWTENAPDVGGDGGRPIAEYFQVLLSWQPQSLPEASSETTTAAEAFDEWFGAADAPAAIDDVPGELEETSSQSSEVETTEADDDDDLEMFRSWLQSLKK